MNVAITGHRGLIGSSLKKRLEAEGHKILFCVDIKEGNDIKNLIDKRFKGIDLLIHTASHCKINQSISDPEKTFKENVVGTFSVFEFCRKNKIPKIIFFSSSRVLNKEKNPYTASKIYGEELCKSYKDSYGLDYIIIRPSTVYGPIWDKTERLIHIFITNALENKNIEIYGNPKTKTLDFTYIDDFIDAILLILKKGGWCEDYNISGGQECNIFNLAEKIINLTNSKSKIIIKPPEVTQPQEVSVDISKIKTLGYKPKVDIDDGIKRTVDFYKNFLREKTSPPI